MNALLAILVAQGLTAFQKPPSLPVHGIYGAHTMALDAAYFDSRDVRVQSPDRRSVAVARSNDSAETMDIQVSGALGRGRFPVAYGPNIEMMWSPDSKALFVTADDGGIVGSYQLTVIGRDHGRLVGRDLTPWLAHVFGHPVTCFEPEVWNVVGVTWLGGSHRLLAAVQIPNHSNCDSMGNFVVYEVDPFTRQVFRRYSQLSAKARFRAVLGPALLSADDDCARQPALCWVPQLHGQGRAKP